MNKKINKILNKIPIIEKYNQGKIALKDVKRLKEENKDVKRLQKENKDLENKVLDITSENEQKIQKVHSNYTKFMGIVSHDLRGPLGNIEGFSGLYEEGEIKKEFYFKYLKSSLKSANHIRDLLTLVGDDLPTLKRKSKNLKIGEKFNDFYNENKMSLDKDKIQVEENYDKTQVNMPEPILNCILANSVGDAFNHALSYINFSLSEDKDHVIYEIENDSNGQIQRKIHGEGNGKGRPFLKDLIEETYQGKVESIQENGKYLSRVYLPKKHVEVLESKS